MQLGAIFMDQVVFNVELPKQRQRFFQASLGVLWKHSRRRPIGRIRFMPAGSPATESTTSSAPR